MMNPRRFATVAAVLCETALVACLVGFGSAGTESNGAVATGERHAPSLTADAPRATAISDAAVAPPAPAISDAAVDSVDIATVAEAVPATDGATAPEERKAIV